MEEKPKHDFRVLTGLLVAVCVSQVVVMGALLYLGIVGSAPDRAVLDRTGRMMQEVFPDMGDRLKSISQQTGDIRREVSELRDGFAHMGDQVAGIRRNVGTLGAHVEGIGEHISRSFMDRVGAIWGNAVNPYLLITLLVLTVVSVPVWILIMRKVTQTEGASADPATGVSSERLEALTRRLDTLAVLTDKAMTENGKDVRTTPEVRDLMQEAQRCITETRAELARLAETGRSPARATADAAGEVH